MNDSHQQQFTQLLGQIRQCQLCKSDLPYSPKPIVQLGLQSTLLIIGHAPGIRAHDSNTPWNDPSGDRLRKWLQLSNETFYNEQQVSLMPMGFCYPGTGPNGDAPPSKQCAPTWHQQVLNFIKPKCIILTGRHAQQFYLDKSLSLTQACQVQPGRDKHIWVLPHPSGRNNGWLKHNPWFESEILPMIQQAISNAIKP